MLKRFSVTNFKNFKDKISFNLDETADYEFNSDVIKHGCVIKGIIYGINGSGKSNLGRAIFDIVLNLTDLEKNYSKYYNYLNLDSQKSFAEFEYVFDFDGIELVYQYGKTDPYTMKYEKLEIDGQEVLCYDFTSNKGHTTLKGTENLQLSSVVDSERLSRIKYIKNNSILEENKINKTFRSFCDFVDRMLLFYSLKDNSYQGFRLGSDNFTNGIIRMGKISEFENFLRDKDINYNLVAENNNGISEIYCRFDNGTVPFSSVASTGTMSLALFYYWYIQMNSASFVYIDEFDAFYHFELSEALVDLLKKLNNTQVVLSTHNTDLLSNDILRPDAYFELRENTIKSFEQRTDKDLRRAHNIQKMYKAGAFNG